MWLNRQQIEGAVGAEQLARVRRFEVFPSISSTNDYLLGLAKLEVKGPAICLAGQQTAGRGQHDKAWVSPSDANIYLSLLWPFDKKLHELGELSLEVSKAVLNAIKRYGVTQDIYVKPPNDLHYQDKKLAGVLVETLNRQPVMAVIGIGLNINMHADDGQTIDQPWIDLASIAESEIDQNRLTGLMIDELISTISCV